VYPGNYDDYMEASTQARERQSNANQKAKEKVQELQEFVRRFSANKSKAKQATSRAKQIEKIKIEEFKPSSRQYPWIRFDYDEKEKLHRQAVEIENLTFGYDPAKPDHQELHLHRIDANDRIAIIGENGVGKTTLLRCWWARAARPGAPVRHRQVGREGQARLLRPGPRRRLRQRREPHRLDQQWVREGGYEGDDVETLIRGTLGRLLFSGDEVKKPVKVISGGEQGRMLFGKLMLLRPTTCC
jgi:ATPase subunit of ABC transporter with duplicated ATPase domains